jgi:sporulation protein YlmC with PRC-barrel domain
MYTRLDRLAGRMVLDATGSMLGRVKAPLVDMETWLVDTLRVTPSRAVANELGLVWSWWRPPTIDIKTGLVQAAADAVILRVSLGELRDAAPTLLTEETPALH